MLDQATITYIIGIIVLLSTGLQVYNSLKKPTIDLEKEDIKVSDKAKALVQQVEWQKEATALRFKELQDSFYLLLKNEQNHLHTLEMKLDKHIEDNSQFIIKNVETLSRIETLLSSHLQK
jgi:hypothetical protein